jgi:hypothetical protein
MLKWYIATLLVGIDDDGGNRIVDTSDLASAMMTTSIPENHVYERQGAHLLLKKFLAP